MKNQFYTLSWSIICLINFILTLQFLGWMGILFLIPFVTCAFLQLSLLWGIIDFNSKYKKHITILSIALVVMYLLREDFSDANISTTFVLNYLCYKMDVISKPFYENTTGLIFLNYLWVLFLPAQITLLTLLRKEKQQNKLSN